MNIVEEVIELLVLKNYTISTAESCTGGFVGKQLTDYPGVSKIYLGGVISYSNEVKMNVLGVSAEILNQFGAVSEQTCKEMLQGIKGLMKSDCAIAITGIAGPDGGTMEKPVGFVCIGVQVLDQCSIQPMYFSGDREEIRNQATEYVFEKLVKMLSGK